MIRVLIPLIAAIAVGCSGSRQKVTQSKPVSDDHIAYVAIESKPAKIADEPPVELASDSMGLDKEHQSQIDKEFETEFGTQESESKSQDIELISVNNQAQESQEPADEMTIPQLPPAVDSYDSVDDGLDLNEVIDSVYQSYPLLEAAFYSRDVASGERLATLGAFDRKVKAGSENGPMGFYKTYRQNIGFIQPLYQGGEAFAGYRIGRGSFQPWYLERQTNDGGEFKAGFSVPLSRNRDIDSRRADLWRATFGREAVEPDIQAQLIGFVQESSYAYWDWVAAGAKLRIAERVLSLAQDRTERIRSQVENGFLDPPELTDNLRLVAERLGKRADAERKLQQKAVKLSLYYRDANGRPMIPRPESLPQFPELEPIDREMVSLDAKIAVEQRPEIYTLDLIQRQLDVDYSQARNDYLPNVDLVMQASQDVGLRTSSINDKGPFELDALLLIEVPVERRKARGKLMAIEGKLSQLNAKRQLTEEKIIADVESAYAGLSGAFEQAKQAQQAVEYAEDLARRERVNFEEGLSDLLKVTLREQYAVESAEKAVDAKLLYFLEQADYRAALAEDQVPFMEEQ
ncbi:TolC family protein [Gimesia aquarii]|uniref:Outer membrane efflux protein n=1 Tax=Gimesia aquarii TaxID=2527964 RepID=A0A517VSE7_9PLAN|nr:TolC family protein [Gimesia aquarii]QDT95936.1 Outer membrane efflux protein [Gimesia aquarii]